MVAAQLDSFVAVPISTELYSELTRRSPAAVSSLIESVAWDFLERTTGDECDADDRSNASFRWDGLSLPHATEVRTHYFGQYKVARIVDGEIGWDGKKFTSMSRLARAMRGNTSNNAWKVLEIKRPGDIKWKLADALRR